jgi:hypothetical protein
MSQFKLEMQEVAEYEASLCLFAHSQMIKVGPDT